MNAGLTLTLGVQQSGDTQLSLCQAEGLLQVLLVALSVHLIHVNQSGPADSKRQISQWKWVKLLKLE